MARMKPSDVLKRIFQLRLDIRSMPYNKDNPRLLEQAYRDFDESIQSSLLDLIRESEEHDDNHHERMLQSWHSDPEYLKTLHQYDNEIINKGDK